MYKNMKRNRILSLAAVAAMMAACSSNDIPAPVVDEMTDTPVTVNASVAELITRADGTPLTSGSLGLYFITEGSDDERYTVSNKEVNYLYQTWTFVDKPLLWKDMSTNVSYYAYYPYVDNIDDDEIITVTAAVDQSVKLGTDFLYAGSITTSGNDTQGGGININFTHQMAKLTVTLRPGTELEYTPTYESVSVGGFINECEFSLSTGHWGDVAHNNITNILMKKKDVSSFEALLIPQENKTLSVTILTEDAKLYVYEKEGVTFEPGKAYTLNLIVGHDKVEVASVSASSWVDEGGGGNIETE